LQGGSGSIQSKPGLKICIMAIIPNGINGPVIGKVGSVVGYISRGKAIIRGRPQTSKSRKPSLLQQQQHAKFALMNQFLKPIIYFLNETKKTAEIDLTGYNKAFSYNVKNAITGSFPDLMIAYQMVLLSRGDLPNISFPGIKPVSDGQIEFSWTDNSGVGMARANDQVFVAVFCEKLNDWETGMQLADRSAGTCLIKIPQFKGHPVQAYMGFLSVNGNDVSDSFYVGSVQVD
jgi:hypothetical protein